MKSALEGLGIAVSEALGLEKAMRGLVGIVTSAANGFTNFFVTLSSKAKLAGVEFKMLGKRISLFFQEFGLSANGLMEKIADVPILGKAIDKEQLAKNKAAYKETIGDLENELEGLKDRQGELRAVINEVYNPSEESGAPLEGDEVTRSVTTTDEFVEGQGEGDEDKLNRLNNFLNKQTRLIQDHEDATHLAKMERMRERALEEAELLGANFEQLLVIREGYDARIKDARDKDTEEVNAKIEEANEKKKEAMLENLDTMSRVFGEETRLGKLALVAKNQMAKIEMKMDGEVTLSKMVKSMAEGTVDYFKGLTAAASKPFPTNVAMVAGHIATALPLFMQLKSAFKSSKASAKISAPSIGGGASGAASVAAPSFNVVGQADAGSQMVADAIQGSNNQPIKAFVVSGEVSNQEELERKANSTASI